MVRKKVDNRIRILIENCVKTHHRSLFVIVGEKARNNVVILHEMLSKAEVRSRPTVLWCYKKDLGFSTNCKKQQRLKKLRAMYTKQQLNEEDPLEYFIASTNIRYCYYSETHSILGQTFGMAILQDFEALTPNLLARTVETVEGGGIVLILLQTLSSLKQLYTMTMDVHARYRTEAHHDIVCRFNERFILSLPTCTDCLVMDDKLNLLPISSNALSIQPLPPKTLSDRKSPEEEELMELKVSLEKNQPLGVLVKRCKTLDQAKTVMKFVETLSEKTLRSTVTLTSARGRGKSAALGLAIAGAIAFKYTNIIVTSPHPENIKTLFHFLLEGLNALGYEKTTDYEEIRSLNPEFNKAVVQVNITRHHRQNVKYVHPSSANKLGLVELVVIDEAAAIPLPIVKSLLGPYLVFMASTINGYEGTGRSLSLKLINQLREKSVNKTDATSHNKERRSLTDRVLHELTLNESIRYSNGDKVEDWLNRLLCLDVTVSPVAFTSLPKPEECKLYYVNRDTLFSYNKLAERFLRKLIAIFVSSHYKNSPNDLFIMSDAPAHHIFCLCSHSKKKMPEILCVLQVCLEGKLSENTVRQELSRGRRGAGDLIPWTVAQEFCEEDFPSLSGVRIVRIATHPDCQKNGYGLHALKLLQEYYEGKFVSSDSLKMDVTLPMLVKDDSEIMEPQVEDRLETRTSLPPLLLELNQIVPERLDYMGVSYGLSDDLLKFWKKAGFNPVYLAYRSNQLTGEHSCIMLKQLDGSSTSSKWLLSFWLDFCEKLVQTLPYPNLPPSLALRLMSSDSFSQDDFNGLKKSELLLHLQEADLKLLKSYCSNPEIGIPTNFIVTVLSQFFFSHRLKNITLTNLETIIFLCVGLLNSSFDKLAKDLSITLCETMKLYGAAVLKIGQGVLQLCEE